MKVLSLLLVLILISISTLFSQRHRDKDQHAREKIEQLEKIKLIEVLQMNEETTLRFFSRRADHQREMEEQQKILKEKINELELLLKSDRILLEGDLKASIDEVLFLKDNLEKMRIEFIQSLNDILTYDQIAMYIVFETRFKQELRKLILREKKTNRQD
jgi:preprotein translocase subunit YajC